MTTAYIPFTLNLEARVVISATGGDPNSSTTLPYIPGSTLRGAVARALGDPGLDPASARHREFRDLVLSDAVSYLNAYPQLAGIRSLPVPSSLRRPKYPAAAEGKTGSREFKAYDLLGSEAPAERLTGLPQAFLSLGQAQPRLGGPAAGARVHHQRDRQMGRAWTERTQQGDIARGAVYAYEYLEAGQSFEGMLVIRGSEAEVEGRRQRIASVLPERILLGRSRHGGYGGSALLAWHEPVSREVSGPGTEGLAPLAGDIAAGQSFRVLLTSAYLGRHGLTGQSDPAWLEEELRQGLAKACGLEEGGVAARICQRWWSFEAAGGFNRKWRLELPQGQAVAAGSVLLLEAATSIPAAAWAKVESAGLGERRSEGFGRLLFLDPPVASLGLGLPEAAPKAAAEAQDKTQQVPPPLVLTLEQRLLEAKAREALHREAALLVRDARRIPPNSLLGRLRVPLRDQAPSALQHLTTWLEDGEEALAAPARQHLDRCRIGPKGAGSGASGAQRTLSAWLLAQAKQAEVEAIAGFERLAQRYHLSTEAGALDALRALKPALSVCLVDAVLAALAIQNKGKDGSDGNAPRG